MTSTDDMRQQIVAVAMSWLGTPYQHMQKCKGAGVDCATFLAAVWEEAGLIPEEKIEFYPIDWHQHSNDPRYLNQLLKHSRMINPILDPPKPADVVVVKLLQSRTINHSAIIVDFPKIIHCVMERGVILDDVRVFVRAFHIIRWNGFP